MASVEKGTIMGIGLDIIHKRTVRLRTKRAYTGPKTEPRFPLAKPIEVPVSIRGDELWTFEITGPPVKGEHVLVFHEDRTPPTKFYDVTPAVVPPPPGAFGEPNTGAALDYERVVGHGFDEYAEYDIIELNDPLFGRMFIRHYK